jgi:hypothetical protein
MWVVSESAQFLGRLVWVAGGWLGVWVEGAVVWVEGPVLWFGSVEGTVSGGRFVSVG